MLAVKIPGPYFMITDTWYTLHPETIWLSINTLSRKSSHKNYVLVSLAFSSLFLLQWPPPPSHFQSYIMVHEPTYDA